MRIIEIVIFGCGTIYNKMKCRIPGNVRILGIIDNNKQLQGEQVDGISIYNPQKIKDFTYDYIVLMSDSAYEMREELLEMGHSPEKIIHYLDFFGFFPNKIKKYSVNKEKECSERKKLLIISVPLSFNGVPIVSLTTGKLATKMGYLVTIAAEEGDNRYIDMAVKEGIQVLLCKWISHASLENLSWMENYDVILVNSLPMIVLAVRISQKRQVVVWIHECLDEYNRMKFWEREIQQGIQNKMLRIYAPSKRAKENFSRFYITQKEIETLPLGIEDKRKEYTCVKRRVFFGVVGGLIERKGQDVFLSAVEMLPEDILEGAFFLLIGAKNVSDFGESIMKRASLINNCILLGERTQQEMSEIYQTLDVLIVPSREETVSMVAIEAMMMEKVCVISDQVGMAEYIEQGKNGFVFQSENAKELNAQILWCYQHCEQLRTIGENARKTYEKNFSMEKFKQNLQNVIH